MSQRVRVAILDSGVHMRNPHIERPIAGGITITPEGEIQGFEDTLGHGTAVCALLQKLAPDAEIFVVKVFTERLATTATTVLRALEWCVQNSMDVVNLSLGTTNEEHRAKFQAAVERVRFGGASLVSAFEVNGMPMLPGSLPGVIGTLEDARCERDELRLLCDPPRVAACPFPMDIAGVPRERNLSGVSFAVAHVSAAIARRQAVEGRQDWASCLPVLTT